MSLLTRNTRFARSLALLLPVAVACTIPVIDIQEVIETHSCTNDAVSMQVAVGITGSVMDVNYEGGSPNVLGVPLVMSNAGGALIVADLDHVDVGEPVSLTFSAKVASLGPISESVSDIEFFKSPWDGVTPPDCSPANGPEFALNADPFGHLKLYVSNPSALPLTIVSLELVESSLLETSTLSWDDPTFNALPWTPAVTGGTVMDGGAPALEIDLPDAATGGGAALCRFISVYDGNEVRGILQANLTGSPVRAQATTWGAVKALYRD